MASDTRAYAGFNTSLGEKRKIRRMDDGTLIGCSSNVPGLSEAVLNWYESGADPEKSPKAAETNFALLVVRPNGEAFYAKDEFFLSGPLSAEFFAIGSGEGAAHGALRMGASAERAVEIAAEVDVWTGLPAVSLQHDTTDHVYPSSPRLLPEGTGVVCDQCGQRWDPAKGEKPDCALCDAAWAKIEARRA